jgi:hypothetical protein
LHENGRKYHSGTICGGVLDGLASYNLLHGISCLGKKIQILNKDLKLLKIQIKSL